MHGMHASCSWAPKLGAVAAFAIACFVDYATVHRWLGNRRSLAPLMQIKYAPAEHA